MGRYERRKLLEATMEKLARIGRLIKDTWLIVGITLFLFGFLEGGVSLAFFIKHRLSGVEQLLPDWRVEADTYADRSWVKKYYEEFRSSDAVRWMPYVYWRRGPYRGEYINVDRNGIRRTTAPVAERSGRSVTIFLFGGSTLWGTGARDDFTIPSVLARELQEKGFRAEVTNFGESGYVTTQEVLTLLLQLRQGGRPDLVIFYDGINDTGSAYQQHVAGLPQNESNRAREFNLSSPAEFKRRAEMVLRDVASRLSTVRLLGGPLGKSVLHSRAEPAAKPLLLNHVGPDDDPPSTGVVSTYWANMELVKALSEHYHFKYLCYWQPTIFQKSQLTKYERGERQKARYLESFYVETYAAMRQSRLAQTGEPAFHDLSLVFSDTPAPVYVDWAHLGEWGNEIIARRMAGDVLGAVSLGSGPRPPPSRSNGTNRECGPGVPRGGAETSQPLP